MADVTFRIGRPTGETIEQTVRRVRAFLWSNFDVVASTTSGDDDYRDFVTVEGIEVAGWTRRAQLDRLASGLLFERKR